jgi:dienelactone hydrolase
VVGEEKTLIDRGNKKRTEFFEKFPGAVHTQSKPVGEWLKLLKEEKGFKKIGAVGYCWGYKVAITAEGARDVFDAIATPHPSYVLMSLITFLK